MAYVVNLQELLQSFSIVNDPMKVDFNKIGDYKGFEIWKGNNGKRDFIYCRYTAFGRPNVSQPTGSNGNQRGMTLAVFSRMVFYKTPFTSANAFKQFVSTYVVD